MIELPLELSVHELNEVRFVDLFCASLVPEVLLEHLYVFIRHRYIIFTKRCSELLSTQSTISISVVPVKHFAQVCIESSSFRGQGLDDILDAQSERFLLNEVRGDHVQEVRFGHVALVPSIEMLVQVVNLPFNELRLNLLEQVSELGRSELLISTIGLRVLVEEILRVDLALDQDLLYLFYDFLCIDSRKLVHKFIKVNSL